MHLRKWAVSIASPEQPAAPGSCAGQGPAAPTTPTAACCPAPLGTACPALPGALRWSRGKYMLSIADLMLLIGFPLLVISGWARQGAECSTWAKLSASFLAVSLSPGLVESWHNVYRHKKFSTDSHKPNNACLFFYNRYSGCQLLLLLQNTLTLNYWLGCTLA